MWFIFVLLCFVFLITGIIKNIFYIIDFIEKRTNNNDKNKKLLG